MHLFRGNWILFSMKVNSIIPCSNFNFLKINLFLLFFFIFADECGWCKRVIAFGSTEFTATSEGLKYCSESCFAQSRRASYKRAKTCDWCKHIRHAVSYVDFQDGASQLQFCSDKCLNQYKMQIFCKETQAHLEMNPHLKEKLKTSNEALITPELWMKNCRSRSITPDQRSNDSTATESPISNIMATVNQMPNITVTPSSKLLSCESDLTKRQKKESSASTVDFSHFQQKSRALRKRRTNRLDSSSNSILSSDNISENSNNNDSSNENRNIHSANMMGEKTRLNSLMQSSMLPTMNTPKISQSDESNSKFVQRYQLMSPHSPHLLSINENRSLHNALRQSAPFIAPLVPNHSFSDATQIETMPKIPTAQIPYSRLPSMSRRTEPSPSSSLRNNYTDMDHHRFFLMQQHQNQKQHQLQQQQKQQEQKQKSLFALNDFVGNVFGTVTPPSTLLIPYPIILPLPLPIPIPLPYEAFLRASTSNQPNKSEPDNSKDGKNFCSNIKTDYKINSDDQPLDFTKEKMVRKISDSETNEGVSRKMNTDRDGGILTHFKGEYSKTELSKIKMNRQPNKRTFTKETVSENNRPLRKRKRIIDCDYLRIRDSNSNESANSRKSI